MGNMEVCEIDSPETRIKVFKRILKESGLYRLFTEERKLYHTHLGPFDEVKVTFHSSIDYSLCWEDTKDEELWSKIYDIATGYNDTLSMSVDHTELIRELKQYVEDYFS